MAEMPTRIPFDEFSENLARIFDRVIRERETIVVENEAGERVAVTPVTPAKSGRKPVT